MYPYIPTQLPPILLEKIKSMQKKYKNAKAAYGPYEILEAVEDLCKETEVCMEAAERYFQEIFADVNIRRTTWLYVGLQKYDPAWPCLYVGRHEWAGHVLDWEEGIREKARQEARRKTKNPNYADPCEKTCVCGMCAWYDTEEHWFAEEQAEKRASKNIFFNDISHGEVFDALLKEEVFWDSTRDCWESWDPMKYVGSSRRFEATPYDAREAAKKMNPVRYVQEWRSVIGRLWSGENIAVDRLNLSVYWGSFFRLYESWQRFSHIRHDIGIIRVDCGELRNVMKTFYG
jgi:hypothetical protein